MKYEFDRSKPFYPLVMTYLIQLHGLKEISTIGVLATANIARSFAIPPTFGEDNKELQDGIKGLLGPLNLAVTGEPERLDVSLDFVAQEIALNYGYLLNFQTRAASFCLSMAHELTKDQPYRDKGAKWEFLRHCRNAVSHNGKWHFQNGEPRNKAEWRGIELKPTMHSQPLFLQQDGSGYLKLGDPIALLWEIENENLNMCV
jgi:hypothetical protein